MRSDRFAAEMDEAVAEMLAAESLTRVLYPDDSTSMGQGLRFVQEFFLVGWQKLAGDQESASLMSRRFEPCF